MPSSLPTSLALTSIADGANIVAADHRNNYLAIQTDVNALIAALSSGTAGQVLQAVTSTSVQWASGAGFLLPPQKYGTLIDVVSSVAETDILQAAGYSVAGNTLGTSGVIRVSITGDYLNNTGGALTLPRLKLKFGGTTLLDSAVGASHAASATRIPFELRAEIRNLGATNAQYASMTANMTTPNAPTTGIGSPLYATDNAAEFYLLQLGSDGTHAIDTTAAKTVQVTATLSSSAATHELRVRHSLIEFL